MDLTTFKKTSLLAQLVFWGLYFFVVFKLLELNTLNRTSLVLKSIYIVLSYAGISYLNALVLIPKFFSRKKYIHYLFWIILIIVLTPLFYLKFVNIIEISLAIPQESNNSIAYLTRLKFTRILIGVLFFIFISTVIRLIFDFSKNERLKLKIEKERLLIETKYLRSQMNPHFFLNSLNNLQAIIRIYPQKAEKYINTLAEMMRYVTYESKNNKVSLSRDIEYIRNYIYFQKIKDQDITVNLKVKIENDKVTIEPMLLMPFIENAFKYGVVEDAKQNPIIIDITQETNCIHFRCENRINTHVVSNTDPSYSGLGIVNVQDRLKVTYPNKHDFFIEKNKLDFIVDVRLYM